MTEILLISSTSVRAELLRRDSMGHWPEEPLMLTADDHVTLTSLDFTIFVRDFYRTSSLA